MTFSENRKSMRSRDFPSMIFANQKVDFASFSEAVVDKNIVSS